MQDAPPLRATTLSGMERQPRNYFLQDVQPPRASNLSGMEPSAPELRSAGPVEVTHDAVLVIKKKLTMGSDPVLAVRNQDQSSMANTRGAPGTRPLRPLAQRWPSAVSAFPRTAGQLPVAFAARSWLHTTPRE